MAISVAAICAAAAGLSFAAAEFIEGSIVMGQALKNILDARRRKRDQELIKRGQREGRRQERERLQREGRLRPPEGGSDNPHPERDA